MNWEHFYLICFAVGFIFSVLSYLLGTHHWHLPHGIHIHTAHLHGGGHAAQQVSGNAAQGQAHFSPLNPAILSAFLAWFGAAGYLLVRHSHVWYGIGLGIAVFSGLIGASIIYLFLSRVLFSIDENMDTSSTSIIGVLGRTSMPIREGGTGEIIYSQSGTRRTCGARAEGGGLIPKGSEVVVLRYENGIAYVRLWAEMAGEEMGLPGAEAVLPAPGKDKISK